MITSLISFSTIFVCFLSIVLLLCIYIIYNLYTKNRIYENWVFNIIYKTENLQKQIREIDERGIFEKDDEVGSAFSEISEIIKEFDHGGESK